MDITAFQLDLSSELEEVIISADGVDVNRLLDRYYECSTLMLDKHAPTVELNKKTRLTQPWFDDGLQDMRRKRRALERKWRKSQLEIDRQLYTHPSSAPKTTLLQK